MIGRLPDLLAAMPLRQRPQREHEDACYLAQAGIVRTASRASLARDGMNWAGVSGFSAKDFRPLRKGQRIDVVICARVDLDHPIYYPDNRFCDCADCGCNLQYRPTGPEAERICVCCAARRVRAAAQ